MSNDKDSPLGLHILWCGIIPCGSTHVPQSSVLQFLPFCRTPVLFLIRLKGSRNNLNLLKKICRTFNKYTFDFS